ncbi:PstA family ABC transporter permease [Lachnoclostridium sp. Marseille-P6806]|uniref:PstA family ABC transporter permease n=1 Tax=Lachnoclostridium sp. Marseille-P6806 TaxID=2364793 RepID=UPI001031E77B|nr:ABC transporter permease subunit [Lachnoclostridium sp. Marseille-P6806]
MKKGLRRRLWNAATTVLHLCAAVTVLLLVFLIGYILWRGLPYLTWELLSTESSYLESRIGILPNLLNTLYIIVTAMLIALPVSVGAAVYLTEYAKNRKIVELIEFAAETLTGIPSIIFGLVGMLIFIQHREGTLAMGAGKWHMIRTVVLPGAVDGIVTGCILAAGRMVGESAALLFTAGFDLALNSFWNALTSSSATLTVALYVYAGERGETEVAFAIAVILLLLTLLINFLADYMAARLRKQR